MDSKLSLNTRAMGVVMIRSVAFILLIPYLLNFGSVAWYALTYLFKPFDPEYFKQTFVPQFVLLVLNSIFFAVLFFGASKISKMIFEDDQVIVLEGDSLSWTVLALQITGLVLLVGGTSSTFSVLQRFIEMMQSSNAISPDMKFWNDTWAVFVRLLTGFLIFRNPAWLAIRMQRYATTDR